MKTKLTGGFSKEVTETHEFKDYANSKYPSGYIGAHNRSTNKDKIVENALRATGLGDHGVAVWLTSGDGRHMMDDIGRTIAEFKERVNEYTKNAFINVTVWSHPDHRGSLLSSDELKRLLSNPPILPVTEKECGEIMLYIIDQSVYRSTEWGSVENTIIGQFNQFDVSPIKENIEIFFNWARSKSGKSKLKEIIKENESYQGQGSGSVLFTKRIEKSVLKSI